MITYKKCKEVSEDTIYQAFKIGFSDYIVKTEMSKDVFAKRLLGAGRNNLEHSFIAFDGDKPVGLNLGSIKNYEGIKTLRCGALCVNPEYRGTEVGKRLFELHKELALENNCKQMFLEVIVGNDRAINFYKKKGYEKVYDIVYYSHTNPKEIIGSLPEDVRIEKIDIDVLKSLKNKIDTHINWQNDFDYIYQTGGYVYYGVFKDNELIGGLSIHPKGHINFLWIDSRYRHRGIGKGIISHAVKEFDIEKLAIFFSNNANLFGFMKKLNFTKDPISQYEMYYIF